MQYTTITEIMNAASAAIFKFQCGNITRDDLYSTGVNLTLQFNDMVSAGDFDQTEAEKTAQLLLAIKHFSTC
ncbi:hypothetical protein [Enterobacter asburiae]|uniref:hypothetical protein n=1 Tax=Enterobacter asburiae TaxID=61645 RepID=UPI003F55379F